MPRTVTPMSSAGGSHVLGIGSLAGKEPRRKRSPKPVGNQLDRALARSHLYLLVSLGYRYPSHETIKAIREELSALASLRCAGECVGEEGDGAIENVRAAIHGLRFEALETEYLRVFTHVITSDCHPCETAYTATHLFQQAQKLADLNGYYAAFGVTPQVERPDHISVEAEFMAFLVQKEAHALAGGRPRRASLVFRTQRGFVEDHLGPWVRAFARFVEIKAEDGFYAALAVLTKLFFEAEFEALSAQVRELKGAPKPLPLLMAKEEEDEDDECPDFATAEPRGVVMRPASSSLELEERTKP